MCERRAEADFGVLAKQQTIYLRNNRYYPFDGYFRVGDAFKIYSE